MTTVPARTDSTALASPLRSIRPASTLEVAILQTLPFPKMDGRQAADAAAKLIGCYPSGKPADPQTYVAAVTAVLADYPAEIVRHVTDPRTGLPRHCKFLPTIAELADALEVEMVPYRRQWREERERKERAREREIAARALPDAQAERRVVDGLNKLANELKAAPDPVPPKRRVREPTMPHVSDYGARVLADIAARKERNTEERTESE